MSIDYSACLVLSVPLDELVRDRTRQKEINKFDENTGEPYTRVVEVTDFIVAGEEETVFDTFEEAARWIADQTGLDWFDENDAIGTIICATSDSDTIDLEGIGEEKQEIHDIILEQFGVDYEPDLEISLEVSV